MLVLTRKPGEKILIGDNIVITALASTGDRIRLGIKAPEDVDIRRDDMRREHTAPRLMQTAAG